MLFALAVLLFFSPTSALWPQPTEVHPGGQPSLLLDAEFAFSISSGARAGGEGSPLLLRATERYLRILKLARGTRAADGRHRRRLDLTGALKTPAPLATLQIEVIQAESNATLALDMDESYSLVVAASHASRTSSSPSATLHAPTVWGALRGLETFSQLVSRQADGVLSINATTIHDAPRFTHRGMLIDTARHYLPMSTLLTVLDSMAYSKLNVMHWHMVDDESFPFASEVLPKLAAGAFSSTHTYTLSMVRQLVAYARDRGIRVLPEFDTPGHTLAWGRGHPELLTRCHNKALPALGPMDPTKNSTWELLHTLFEELTTVFPDAFMHLGGDEVDKKCWASNPDVRKWVAEKGGGNVEAYHGHRVAQLANTLARTAVVWEDLFNHHVAMWPLNTTTVVQVWRDEWQTELARVTKAGHRALLSTNWYLNYLHWPPNWQEYYRIEPTDFPGSAAQKALVLGGEVCMWGEYVDATNLIPRLWHKAAAVAERLWSARDQRDEADAARRLHEFRCLLLTRGINAEPLGKGDGFWFCEPEFDPDGAAALRISLRN